VLGAIIGIDKDIGKQKKSLLGKSHDSGQQFGGIRTFGLIALFGSMMTWLDAYFTTSYIFIISGLFLITIIVSIYYSFSVFKNKALSPATEIIAFLTYFV